MTATDAPNFSARLTRYARDDLRRLITPRSVAIVGASDRKGSFGNRAMEDLQSFDGPVHLVNARATSVAATRSRHVLLEPANVRLAPEPVLPTKSAAGPIGDVYGLKLCARQALSKEGDQTNAKQITLAVRQPE